MKKQLQACSHATRGLMTFFFPERDLEKLFIQFCVLFYCERPIIAIKLLSRVSLRLTELWKLEQNEISTRDE